MNTIVLIIIIVSSLVIKMVIKNVKKNVQENTPPVSSENKGDIPWFEQIFGNLNEEKPVKQKQNSVEKPIYKPKPATSVQEKKTEIIKEKQLNNEDDFDLRKAVIYSEILNNPFIEKTR